MSSNSHDFDQNYHSASIGPHIQLYDKSQKPISKRPLSPSVNELTTNPPS